MADAKSPSDFVEESNTSAVIRLATRMRRPIDAEIHLSLHENRAPDLWTFPFDTQEAANPLQEIHPPARRHRQSIKM